MAGHGDDPARQFSAAWQAAAAALGKWRKQVTAATAEALDELDPAVRAALEAARAAFAGNRRGCQCQCPTAHPQDKDVCDGNAILTRRLGESDVPLCAPCAVAQGVAEMPR
jgi:acetoin utilization deacetylase AcuC-like enzyme